MDLTALLLSRLQFAFTISFHIIFPSFTIGLAAWLTILEALNLWTGRPAYRLVFEFWLKIFGVAFGLRVVSGIVMAFQFGTNWSVLARMSGPIQGPLLSRRLPPSSSRLAMSPFSITIEQAAAPHSSLAFIFWGEGLFVFPLMLLYTVISYSVFRGKVRPTADHY